jgi:hypothetical protein
MNKTDYEDILVRLQYSPSNPPTNEEKKIEYIGKYYLRIQEICNLNNWTYDVVYSAYFDDGSYQDLIVNVVGKNVSEIIKSWKKKVFEKIELSIIPNTTQDILLNEKNSKISYDGKFLSLTSEYGDSVQIAYYLDANTSTRLTESLKAVLCFNRPSFFSKKERLLVRMTANAYLNTTDKNKVSNEESELAVQQWFFYTQSWCEKNGYDITILLLDLSFLGGYREIIFSIESIELQEFLSFCDQIIGDLKKQIQLIVIPDDRDSISVDYENAKQYFSLNQEEYYLHTPSGMSFKYHSIFYKLRRDRMKKDNIVLIFKTLLNFKKSQGEK